MREQESVWYDKTKNKQKYSILHRAEKNRKETRGRNELLLYFSQVEMKRMNEKKIIDHFLFGANVKTYPHMSSTFKKFFSDFVCMITKLRVR